MFQYVDNVSVLCMLFVNDAKKKGRSYFSMYKTYHGMKCFISFQLFVLIFLVKGRMNDRMNKTMD